MVRVVVLLVLVRVGHVYGVQRHCSAAAGGRAGWGGGLIRGSGSLAATPPMGRTGIGRSGVSSRLAPRSLGLERWHFYTVAQRPLPQIRAMSKSSLVRPAMCDLLTEVRWRQVLAAQR